MCVCNSLALKMRGVERQDRRHNAKRFCVLYFSRRILFFVRGHGMANKAWRGGNTRSFIWIASNAKCNALIVMMGWKEMGRKNDGEGVERNIRNDNKNSSPLSSWNHSRLSRMEREDENDEQDEKLIKLVQISRSCHHHDDSALRAGSTLLSQ